MIFLPTLCWPTTPLKVPTHFLIKYSDLKKYRAYSGTTTDDLNTCNSVVPAPIAFGKSLKTIDFLFSRQGEIFATATSPSAKWVKPVLIDPHFRFS